MINLSRILFPFSSSSSTSSLVLPSFPPSPPPPSSSLVLHPPHPLFSPPLYPVVVTYSSICQLAYCMYIQGLTECWQYCMNVVWKLMLLQVLIRCCRYECDHNLGDDTSLIHTRGGAWSKLGVEPGPSWGQSLGRRPHTLVPSVAHISDSIHPHTHLHTHLHTTHNTHTHVHTCPHSDAFRQHLTQYVEALQLFPHQVYMSNLIP